MARGISLHIGLNEVDPASYEGWDGHLRSCEQDARDMQAIATSLGYETSILLTKDATTARVIAAIEHAAATLVAGDVFLLTYSGHGGQVPDVDGDETSAELDELGEYSDGYDETWLLYDRMLIDDELYALWAKFAAGVRIIMTSDSCHSGTISKAPPWEPPVDPTPPRRIPLKQEEKVYEAHKQLYDGIQAQVAQQAAAELATNVVLISGCMDTQLSYDGHPNGRFTARLLKVWDGGQFTGSLPQLHEAIVAGMPSHQTPNYYVIGPTIPGFATSPALRI